MKKLQVGFILVFVAGFIFLAMPVKAKDKSDSGTLEIIYIGSSGYLIKSANKKIIVDGAFDNFVKKFEVIVPTDKTRDKIGNGEEPFDSIDLFLVTHSHKGHFDRQLLAQAILNNPEAQVVTNKGVYEELQDNIPDFESFIDRVYFPDLQIGESETKTFKDVEVIMTKTDHWGGLLQLNFEFEVDGINILYALEADGFKAEKEVDLQFLNSFDSEISPKHLILTHQSGYDNIQAKAEEAESLENLSVLTNSLDKLELVF